MKSPKLSDFEQSKAPDDADYLADLEKLQHRLQVIQTAYVTQKLRAIVMLEGWDASGKGGIIGRLTAELDPRFFKVWSIAAPTAPERERHFLYRFWTRLPGHGEMAIFDRSWYGRVLVERVEKLTPKADWQRAYDEINQFEAQQVDDGVRLVKFFVHITQDEQDSRLRDRLESPWKRWKTGLDDYRNRSNRAGYAEAIHDMLHRTQCEAAPWHVIAGNSKKHARLAALEIIADRLAHDVDLDPPPVSPELRARAEHDLGVKLNLG